MGVLCHPLERIQRRDKVNMHVRIAEARAMAAMHHSTSEGTNAEPTTIYVHTVANETTLKMYASVRVTRNHLAAELSSAHASRKQRH